MNLTEMGIDWVERGWIPDWLTRAAIRRLCRERLRETNAGDCQANRETFERFLADMDGGPIAPVPELANEQHYELPAEFFSEVLGTHRKYSCCHFTDPHVSLAEAERDALRITCERAELRDGQDVLELGCGWGSLSLWMAEHFPNSRVTAVSNSRPQRQFIERAAASRGLNNLRVLTADMNGFDIDRTFDRVVSVEMFEHMRNYGELLRRIHGWLKPSGRLFVHIFCHRERAYAFDAEGAANWMGRYFFSGGIMPNDGLLARCSRHFQVTRQWRWSGMHYARTADAWLANLDRRRESVMPILREAYGAEASRWFHRWRMFFLAVSELFRYGGGDEWFVGHYWLTPHPISQQGEFDRVRAVTERPESVAPTTRVTPSLSNTGIA